MGNPSLQQSQKMTGVSEVRGQAKISLREASIGNIGYGSQGRALMMQGVVGLDGSLRCRGLFDQAKEPRLKEWRESEEKLRNRR